MVEEFFLQAGWETAVDHAPASGAVLKTVATERIDVIGFSVACEEFFDPLMDLIKRVRKAALNSNLAILVGGRLVVDHPEIKTRTDAAIFVSDGLQAVSTAEDTIASCPRSVAVQGHS
jgi:methylmalonyl-CoA mutase cobalamin-binding subunit